MRRGTRVGQAYVALTVDGDGVNNDIADALDDVDYEKIGRDGAGRYEKGWKETRAKLRDRLGSNPLNDLNIDESLERIRRAINNEEQIGRGIAKDIARAFDDGKLERLIKHVGEQAGTDFSEEFNRVTTKSVLETLERTQLEAARRSGRDGLNGLTFEDGGLDLLGPDIDKMVADAERGFAEIHRAREKDHNETVKFLETEERLREEAARAAHARLKDDQRFLRFS